MSFFKEFSLIKQILPLKKLNMCLLMIVPHGALKLSVNMCFVTVIHGALMSV